MPAPDGNLPPGYVWATGGKAVTAKNPSDAITELLERADAVAARYDAAIRAHHSCEGDGLCPLCQEWDERLIEIERAERDRRGE